MLTLKGWTLCCFWERHECGESPSENSTKMARGGAEYGSWAHLDEASGDKVAQGSVSSGVIPGGRLAEGS